MENLWWSECNRILTKNIKENILLLPQKMFYGHLHIFSIKLIYLIFYTSTVLKINCIFSILKCSDFEAWFSCYLYIPAICNVKGCWWQWKIYFPWAGKEWKILFQLRLIMVALLPLSPPLKMRASFKPLVLLWPLLAYLMFHSLVRCGRKCHVISVVFIYFEDHLPLCDRLCGFFH